jgi:hypothetical protein
MKKVSGEWRFLSAGVAALVLGFGLSLFVPLQNEAMHFIEGLCLGFSLTLLLCGLMRVRRDSLRDSGGV